MVDTTSYTYDANNDLTSETLPNMDGNGPSISYQYDAYGNMTAKKQQLNTGGDYSLSQYAYDSHGRLTEQQDLISGTVSGWTVSDPCRKRPTTQTLRQTAVHRRPPTREWR